MREIVETAALLIAGPMVGVEIAVAAFANPVVGRLPDEGFAKARGDASRVLGRVMPFWYIATLMMLVVAAVVLHPAWLLTAAAALMAVVVLLTVLLMVPINNRIGRWSGAAAVDRDLARRWDRLHWLRVGLLLVVYLLLVLSV